MERGIRFFPLTYFYLPSTDVYICVCILCKRWHVYTGRSCFILDPFGFSREVLNVNFIEALAERISCLLRWQTGIFTPYLKCACMYENCDAIVFFFSSHAAVFFAFILCYVPLYRKLWHSYPHSVFCFTFSETLSTETEQILRWGLSALLLLVTFKSLSHFKPYCGLID